MALCKQRRQSRCEGEELTGETYYRITENISLKTPKVEWTISTWKLAKTQKSFKQRCTRWETGGFCMTNIGIVTAATIFCCFVAPNLFIGRDNIGHPHKLSDNPCGIIVLALAITFSSTSLLFLWLTHITDPGVIPRQREIETRMLSEGERHCDECKIIRPPRGKHCRHCNHCVEVFDHHCPYAGVCVGNGNYLFFCLLLISGIISSTFVSVFSVWFLKDNWPAGHKTWEGLKFDLVALMLTIACGLIFFVICHLSLYHVFIVVTKQTTNEWIKYKRSLKLISNDDALPTEPLLGSGSRPSRDGRTRYSFRSEPKESITSYDDETSLADSRICDA